MLLGELLGGPVQVLGNVVRSHCASSKSSSDASAV